MCDRVFTCDPLLKFFLFPRSGNDKHQAMADLAITHVLHHERLEMLGQMCSDGTVSSGTY